MYQEFDAERGRRISAAMEKRGLKYNCQLCYDIGVSESTLSRWRAGRPLSLSHAVALSYGLGISLDYLLIGPAAGEQAGAFSTQVDKLREIYAAMNAKNRGLALSLVRTLVARLEAALPDALPDLEPLQAAE